MKPMIEMRVLTASKKILSQVERVYPSYERLEKLVVMGWIQENIIAKNHAKYLLCMEGTRYVLVCGLDISSRNLERIIDNYEQIYVS